MKLSSGSVILGVLSFILACNGQSQKTVSTVNVDNAHCGFPLFLGWSASLSFGLESQLT